MILARGYRVEDKLPTYRELADHFGVALFTIERVMKELAREGIIQLLHGKGAFIKQLPAAAGQLRQVGLICPASRLYLVRNAYMTEILAGIVDGCDQGQIDLQILSFWRAGQRVPVPPHETAVRVDGAILLGMFNDDYIAEFVREEIPLVLVDGQCRTACVHSITMDNGQAVDQVMDHLHGLGHRRIAYVDARSYDPVVGQWATSSSSRERREAYLAAMQRLGLAEQSRVYESPAVQPDVAIEQAARRLLQEGDPPTAVLVYDTNLAAILCHQLCQGNRRIPQDISVAGVAGYRSRTAGDEFTVTGSQVLFEEMGRLAMQALAEQACGRMPSEPIIQRIGVRFCVGTTTAAARC
jgi:DNA-binding LacI/PurR family transcriptional regulator